MELGYVIGWFCALINAGSMAVYEKKFTGQLRWNTIGLIGMMGLNFLIAAYRVIHGS